MKISVQDFGKVGEKTVQQYILKNDNGLEISSINYGCTITSILAPDQNGNYENIVLGYDSLEEYLQNPFFLGAVCGRVAGRIKDGSFELEGQSFSLAQNDHGNHLHGGIKGFDKVVWDGEIIQTENAVGVRYSYFSPAGEEGYPGNLTIQVTYTLNNENELKIEYVGKTDKSTLLNVTNHSYFNLSGNLKRDITEHSLTMKSNQFLELNDELLPTGRILEVKGTPFDFTTERRIITGINSDDPQNMLVGNGYDHPFLLDTHHDQEIVLKDAESGRTMTIETDEAGVVVYSGNSISNEGEIRGVPLRKHLGICLETQGLPDSIHHDHFPSCILTPNEIYSKVTTYRFGIEGERV